MTQRNTLASITLTALTKSTDTAVAWPGKDEHMILVIVNGTNACDLTIKAGDGIMGVADKTLSLAASTTYLVKIESMRFLNTTGTNKGKIVLNASNSGVTVGTAEML